MNDDCSKTRHFFCSISQYAVQVCPDNYFSYKNMCLKETVAVGTYAQSKVSCSNAGSIVLPIKSEGLYKFIKLHTQFRDASQIFLGMSSENQKMKYTDYSEFGADSFNFDMTPIINDSQCVILDNTKGFKPTEVDCNDSFEYYCLWKSKLTFYTKCTLSIFKKLHKFILRTIMF